MSMHNILLTAVEEAGLKAHGLAIGTPSQLSDAFRHGVKWANDHSEDSPLHPQYVAGFKSGAYAARRRMELNPHTAQRVKIDQVTCPKCAYDFVAYVPDNHSEPFRLILEALDTMKSREDLVDEIRKILSQQKME